jgi:hypothetical protein
MALADLLRRRQTTTPEPGAPDLPPPLPTSPTASPAVPGTDPQKMPSGPTTYDWRPEAYQDPLSQAEQDQQRAEYQFRDANQGMKLPADSAGIQQMIAASQSGTASRQPSSYTFGNMPGFQFDDPYTKQLEDLVRQNLTAIQTPQANPALDQLTAFLNKQFTDLSTSPGYSPEELALIRTQMLEPIEADRQANRDRVTQRTAARGMLPSSGLHEQDLQQFVDQPATEARTRAQRDIAVNAIGQRRDDINQAMNLGRVSGIEIPGLQRAEDQSRRSEALNLSSLLYDLPNRAMQSAQSVIAGSPGPQDLFTQALQMQQANQQQQALNAQKWQQIGQLIAGLF